METSPSTGYPRAVGQVRVDVAVIGGGIAGLSTAHELKQRGRTVAVVEAGRIATSVTGYTTAKITSLHTKIYTELVAHFGDDSARVYGQSQQAGLERIAHWVDTYSIDCDFARQPAFTYAVDGAAADELRREAETAAALGLPASYVTATYLPFQISGAVRFDDQAQFHPRRFLLALAARIPGDGSHVFEQTRMLGVQEGQPCTVTCDVGEIVADDVVLATHYPVLDRGLMFARLEPHRDVVVAGLLPPGQRLDGMFISTEADTHSVRCAPHPDGQLLIVGGEPWKTGHDEDIKARYDRLAAWAAEHFGLAVPTYRWSTQDNTTADGVPYIGPFHAAAEHLYVAAGFRGWGMTNGTVAGMLLADLIGGVESPWAQLYDPRRVKALTSAKTVLKLGADAVKGLIGETFTPAQVDSVDEIGPGEGAVAQLNGDKAAVYRDEAGELHCLSARCTHLGCVLHFNNAEKSWDCPCHGSRFDHDGAVLQGPANRPLERREPPAPRPATPVARKPG
jgi:glycine/D-amino acid oxidase-like deaminating enzyme/nitrite reductase/ring-hydroxylating ferredoxin subunit